MRRSGRAPRALAADDGPDHAEAARQRAVLLDSDKWATLGGSLAAAVASLGAIALDLASTPGERVTAGDAAFATGAVALSWAFVHVLLAHHYMHEYWLEGGRGLVFPGVDRPGTSDFLYLALSVRPGSCGVLA